MSFDLKSSSKSWQSRGCYLHGKLLMYLWYRALLAIWFFKYYPYFSYAFQILLIYFYLLIGTNILFTKKQLSKNRPHNFSLPFNSDIQSPPSNAFDCLHFCYSSCSTKCPGGQHKREPHSLPLQLYTVVLPKKGKKRGREGEGKGEGEREGEEAWMCLFRAAWNSSWAGALCCLPCAQQRKALVPHINQRWRNMLHLPILPWQTTQPLVPFRNSLPMKAAAMDNRDTYNNKRQWLGPKSAYAATTQQGR